MHHFEFALGAWESLTSLPLATNSKPSLKTVAVSFSIKINFLKVAEYNRTLKSAMQIQAKMSDHWSQQTHRTGTYRSSKTSTAQIRRGVISSAQEITIALSESFSQQPSVRSVYSTNLRIRQPYLTTPPMNLAQQHDLLQGRLSYRHGKVLKDDVR